MELATTCPAALPVAPPAGSILRAVVLRDGRVKASFADNTVVVLNAAGNAFTAFPPAPVPHHRPTDDHTDAAARPAAVRQLTEYATSRFASKVAQVVALRNTYVPAAFFSPLLLSQGVSTLFQTRFPVSTVHWSRSVAAARRDGLLQTLPDGSITLHCEEELVRVVLSPHRRQLAVLYPLLVAPTAAAAAAATVPFFHYMWQAQVLSVAACPPPWLPALQLLQTAADAPPEDGERAAAEAELDRGAQVEMEAKVLQAVEQQADRAASRTTLPTSTERAPVVWEPLQPGSWWESPALVGYPEEAALQVAVEWTPTAVFRPLGGALRADGRGVAEVEVVLTSDASTLVSSHGGRFFRHLTATQPTRERVFSASAVPQSSLCNLVDVVDRAQALLHACNVAAACATATAEREAATTGVARAGATLHTETVAGMSMEVTEETHVEGAGCFTAYADGRVRVAFCDRTLLEMDAAGELCRLVLHTGDRQVVRTAAPLSSEPYVSAAVEFSRWVRAGPAARDAWLAQRMRIERSVQAELRSTGQLLCCMSHHVPHTTLAAPAPAATDMQSCVAALLARNQEMQRLLVS